MKQSYASRVFAGLWWGVLWAAVVMLGIFLIFPVFSLPLIAVVASICIIAGIVMNLRVSQQACPSCGTVSKVMPTGSKCPNCGRSLSA